MAVADGFLAGGGGVYFVEGQGDFDQFLAGFCLLHAHLSVPGGGPRQDVAVGFGDSIGQLALLEMGGADLDRPVEHRV